MKYILSKNYILNKNKSNENLTPMNSYRCDEQSLNGNTTSVKLYFGSILDKQNMKQTNSSTTVQSNEPNLGA